MRKILKKLLFTVIAIVSIICCSISAFATGFDVNADNKIDVNDVTYLQNEISEFTDNTYFDLNGDGIVNVNDDSSLLEIENGRDYVTLVTCYPYSINTHRLCVRGERIENESTATTDETADSSSKYYSLLGIRLTLLILVFIIAGLVLGLSIKKSILSKS